MLSITYSYSGSHLLQRRQHSIIRRLRLIVRIKQQRVTRRPPRIRIPNTPDRYTNTIRLAQTSLNNIRPIRRLRILNINLGHRTLRRSRTQRSHSRRRTRALARSQMGLRADPIDRDAGRAPGFDVLDHGLRLGGRGGVEVCVR